MKIYIRNDDERFPFLLVDNFYTEDQEKKVWKEFEFYESSGIPAPVKDEDISKYEDGTPRGKNLRVYPDAIFKTREASNILRFQYENVFSEEVKNSYKETSATYRWLNNSNSDFTIISYYEDDHYYKAHFDSCQISCCIWMFREPKAFSGGEFTFTDSGVSLDCVNNRMVLFPGYYKHSVSPIKMKREGDNLGRYTITHFYQLFN